ncbi:hypothetical protein JHK86_055573 [Glycine max]|nr:hypothetical protein JHK86_055573 [Glycine max]
MLTKPSVFGVLGFSERSTLDYPYLHGNRPPISDISLSGLCGQLLTWYSPLPLEKKLELRWEGKEQVGTTRKVRSHSQLAELRRRHPFIDGILNTPLPLGWKPLNIDQYDKTTDPDEHLEAYITQVAPIILRQADNESLRDFMGRFSQIAVMIHDLELGVALHAMIAALKPGVFAYSLCKKQPMSMNKK